jgi:hypothetical protein
MAELLGTKAKVPLDRPCSLVDIPAFEKVLDCHMWVVCSEMGNKFLYKGHEGLNKKRLFVYLVEGENELAQYHSIVKISGFFTQSYFCETTTSTNVTCTVGCARDTAVSYKMTRSAVRSVT